VPAEVALLVRLDRDLALGAAIDCDGTRERADHRVVRLEFVSAVSGHPVSREAADAVVAARLGRLRPGLASI
jgi:hypothetical protein